MTALSLTPGQTLRGLVQGEPGQLFLQLGGTRVPLAADVPLRPGVAVAAQVVQSDSGLQLRLTPLPSSQAAAETPAVQSPWAALVASATSTLGTSVNAETVIAMLPMVLPPSESGLRQLVTLLSGRSAGDGDLEQIAAVLAKAVDAGALPRAVLDEFSAISMRLVSVNQDELTALLVRLAGRRGRSVAARIALAIAKGDVEEAVVELQGELRTWLARLTDDPALTRYLRSSGQLRDFTQAAGRVLERLDAAEVQNLHAHEGTYLFLEVPLGAEWGIPRAFVHFLGQGARGRHAFDAKNASVVLDLATTHLGDLWVTLSVRAGHCSCMIRAVDTQRVEMIEAAAPALAEALQGVGFPGATVQVAAWNGDRLEEIAKLMGAREGIDFQV